MCRFARYPMFIHRRLIAAVAVLVAVCKLSVAQAQTPMEIDTTAIDFGAVNVANTSATLSVTLTNTDGAASFGPIDFFGGAPPSPEFSASQSCQGATLAPGGTCNVNYTFTPSAPTAFNDASSFTLSETGDPADGESFLVTLAGEGINPITSAPLSHDFGNVNVGNTSATIATVVTNTSGDPFGPLSIFGGAPPSGEFSASQSCQGATLAPGGTCSVNFTVSPPAPAAFNGSSSFTISAAAAGAGESFTVTLAGVGINPITAAPLLHDFGNVDAGTTSGTLSTVITNTSSDPFGPLSIFGGAPPTPEFSASQSCQGATLTAGGTCSVNYTFSPSAPGVLSDTSFFTISAAGAGEGESFSVTLSGCGVNTGEMCPATTTSTTVVCAPTPSIIGASVACTATVTSAAVDPPTGSVAFTVDGNPLSSVALAGGQATVNTTAFPLGVNAIVAGYTPDTGAYLASTSAPFNQTVQSVGAVVGIPTLPLWAIAILVLLLMTAGILFARGIFVATGGPDAAGT